MSFQILVWTSRSCRHWVFCCMHWVGSCPSMRGPPCEDSDYFDSNYAWKNIREHIRGSKRLGCHAGQSLLIRVSVITARPPRTADRCHIKIKLHNVFQRTLQWTTSTLGWRFSDRHTSVAVRFVISMLPIPSSLWNLRNLSDFLKSFDDV